ncbi:peptide-methionine (S)-S-oxide reductase MsrA [Bdellovibrio bacteriovorus]|uniref:peptide-methionine (S)-S-oxide reductase MsrA n=1 Tax=Bdellovibrio bacteriovorus TaxID=959 RepID=UPI0021D07801|nr:peptide-methionine (S)-S-oxide reductase MsrA [Bdellovibrio bacteriovorus]UXR65179.1 peptide-methionine (S)-S-oxide reductase MsrA [Bdellovibrio bacteriovorus]
MKALITLLIALGISFGCLAQTTPSKKGNNVSSSEVTYLAGGCFWGMEDLLRKLPGVLQTEVGYMGGDTRNATYNIVKTGTTNHAETVKITFDPTKLKYQDLLLYFFKIHDPTTTNRQGNDIGTQYRSAIFYTSDKQKDEAEIVRARVEKSDAWKNPVVTQIVKAADFWSAEEYHQDYLQKNPGGYTCHFERKIEFK